MRKWNQQFICLPHVVFLELCGMEANGELKLMNLFSKAQTNSHAYFWILLRMCPIKELVLFGAIQCENFGKLGTRKFLREWSCVFKSIKSMLASTMSEHSSTISLPRLQQRPRRSISWVRPEAGAIEFNVNAAVGLVCLCCSSNGC